MLACPECAELERAKVDARHRRDMSEVTDILVLIARHKRTR